MHRVFFGDNRHNNNLEWIVFECSLDNTIKALQDDFINRFRNDGNGYNNEHTLHTNGKNKFVLPSDIGTDMWCLDVPSLRFEHNRILEMYRQHTLLDLAPDQLNFDEFKAYRKILCTNCGDYGHIYLSIEAFDPDANTWSNVFSYDD